MASSRTGTASAYRPNCRSPQPRWYSTADSPHGSLSARNAAAAARPVGSARVASPVLR